MQTYTKIEELEDFIKVSFSSNEISERCANELLRLTSDMKDELLTPPSAKIN